MRKNISTTLTKADKYLAINQFHYVQYQCTSVYIGLPIALLLHKPCVLLRGNINLQLAAAIFQVASQLKGHVINILMAALRMLLPS